MNNFMKFTYVFLGVVLGIHCIAFIKILSTAGQEGKEDIPVYIEATSSACIKERAVIKSLIRADYKRIVTGL